MYLFVKSVIIYMDPKWILVVRFNNFSVLGHRSECKDLYKQCLKVGFLFFVF